MRDDLNSVLVEGRVLDIHEKEFTIQNVRSVEDTDDTTGMINNQFLIRTSYGRKHPLKRGMKVRIVGRLQHVEGDETVIIPDHMDIPKQK